MGSGRVHLRSLGVCRGDGGEVWIPGLDFRGNGWQQCRFGSHHVLEAVEVDAKGADEMT